MFAYALVGRHGGISVFAKDAEERTHMLRVLIALFWVSLIVGTLVAHGVVANWAVTLAALYFTTRWWADRRQAARKAAAAGQPNSPNAASASSQPGTAVANASTAGPVRSRWTVDRVHSAERPWR